MGRSRALARDRGGARLDRRARRSRSATASSSITARPTRASPTRAGRTPTTRSSTPTVAWPKARSRSPRCKATSTAPSSWPPAARERLGRMRARERSSRAEADALAERFDASFWCPEIDTYALALDGDKEPCRVRSSNAGQVLFTGIAKPERAAMVADAADCGRSSSPAGASARLPNTEARYNPMSYHNGSIWPHDNALIALGLRPLWAQALDRARCSQGLFDAATYMELRRLPELFCGFQRGRGRGPTLYPVACAPQAWASATPFTLLEASLGLQFDPHGERDPPAQSAPAAVPRRRGAAQSAAQAIERRSQGHASRRRGFGGDPARGEGRYRYRWSSPPIRHEAVARTREPDQSAPLRPRRVRSPAA